MNVSHSRPVSLMTIVFNIEISGFYACKPWRVRITYKMCCPLSLHFSLSSPFPLPTPLPLSPLSPAPQPQAEEGNIPFDWVCSAFAHMGAGISRLSKVHVKVLTLVVWHPYQERVS